MSEYVVTVLDTDEERMMVFGLMSQADAATVEEGVRAAGPDLLTSVVRVYPLTMAELPNLLEDIRHAHEQAEPDDPPTGTARSAAATWWWSVMVGGAPLASYSVEVLGRRGAKNAAKAFGKEYIRQGAPGSPQIKLTRTMPEGSIDRTPAGP